MNMMFSCLFGVGYVVVRYRKSGFLRRLSATPVTAFEFGAAQVLSRLLVDRQRDRRSSTARSRSSCRSATKAASCCCC